VNNKKITEHIEYINNQKVADAFDFALSKYDLEQTQYYIHSKKVFKLLKMHGYGINQQLAAILQNIHEITNTSYDEILKYSNNDVVQALKIISLSGFDFTTEQYVDNISKNSIACPVKLADICVSLNNFENYSVSLKITILEDIKEYYDKLLIDSSFAKDYRKLKKIVNKRR
jgi:thioester reductase-like protein